MIRLLPTALAVLALAGCGDDGEAEVARTQPARVTPVPSTSAPVPTPEDEIHATATPTPTVDGEAAPGGAGDEEGLDTTVRVTLSDDAITVEPDEVVAFLPLVFEVSNTTDRELAVVVQTGEGRRELSGSAPAGGRKALRTTGLQPGQAVLLSPDLGPEASAELTVSRAG